MTKDDLCQYCSERNCNKNDCKIKALQDQITLLRESELLSQDKTTAEQKFQAISDNLRDNLPSKILKDPNIFNRITEEEFDKKIVGEVAARKVIFLVANMRNVENLNKATDNLMVNAFSGTGKDHITEAIFDFFPSDEKEELIRTTPKVLAYTRNKALNPKNTWKKTTLRLEDVSNEVLNDDAFKVISSANPNKINYGKIVNKGKILNIEIEGKPSIIMTIADANPKEETLRRFPVLYLDEGIDQTKAVLQRQAQFAMQGKSTDYNEDLKISLSLLQRVKVKVPFADKLVNIFCAENVIVRTHFPRFLDYIKSACAFHQYQREEDKEGYFIPTKEDYELARLALQKTTSNILMIPLTKLRKNILDLFEKENLQNKSVDDLEGFEAIKKLNITPEWLRKQLDWLTSKGFLLKASEKRTDATGKIIPKPVNVYSYNKLQQLIIPSWEELSSITSNKEITSISSNSSNTNEAIYENKGVNEVFEQFEQKKDISPKAYNSFLNYVRETDRLATKQGKLNGELVFSWLKLDMSGAEVELYLKDKLTKGIICEMPAGHYKVLE